MNVTITLFWLSLFILFFCYAGYGLFLLLWNQFKKKRTSTILQDSEMPAVTVIIPAYNEKEVLLQKIRNTLEVIYPSDKLRIIVITDGSIDGSEKIFDAFPGITGMHQQERKGKSAAINRAMQQVETPLVVFTDANTMLNPECLERMVVHYRDPKTGGVAGEKKISSDHGRSGVGDAEGLYWQYESFLKKQDADFHTVVGAAGELFSIRTALFRPIEEKIILDDFSISMQVCLQGFRIKYEPGAFAIESPSASLSDESKRKIRISAGAYQSIGYLKKCLNPFFDPVLTFQYISRRMLRWVFCPLMLILLLITNFIITNTEDTDHFFLWFLYAQLTFYLLAIIGGFLIQGGSSFRLLTIPFYFVFMNYCLVRGFIGYLTGKQTVIWQRSDRLNVSNGSV